MVQSEVYLITYQEYCCLEEWGQGENLAQNMCTESSIPLQFCPVLDKCIIYSRVVQAYSGQCGSQVLFVFCLAHYKEENQELL